MTNAALRTVLFDLDGTLADTAPELAATLNVVLNQEGLASLPYERIRPMVSHGATALVKLGFGTDLSDARLQELRTRLLKTYEQGLGHMTQLFAGMAEVLETLERRGLNWGVVTNKPAFLTEPLLTRMGLQTRAATIISGDSLPQRKPDPAPLLLACTQAGSAPAQCLYIGDAQRDIEAGRRAGTKTLVALFGYLDTSDTPQLWGADGLVNHPLAILDWLDSLY